jgi:hypothetical protein
VPQPAPVTDAYARHVLARLLDFFTEEGTPWPRRLWDIGSILALEELWEASSWQAAGVLSHAACDWQRNQLRAVIGPDVGLGERELRREVTEILSSPLAEFSAAHRRLRQVIDHAKADYLARWAVAVTKTERPKAERFSRIIASHLLDLGFSASYLKSWTRSLIWQDANAEHIAASAVDHADRAPQTYEVLIALDGIPHRALAELVDTWRSKRQVIEWLAAHEFDTVGIRNGGGFAYSFQAQDPYMAAEQARQMLERMIARSSFLRSGRGGVTPLPQLWVAGHKDPIRLHPPARGADVLTLVHEEHLYKVHGARSRIDDALELAAPVNQGPLAPAVAGAWAAVESLLSQPEDSRDAERSGKAIAADRFAELVACSWPRAELSTLAHRHSPTVPDALSMDIAGRSTNREKARAVAEALLTTGSSALEFGLTRTRDSDQQAAERMTELVADPRQVLGDVATTFKIAMRRLYRARNIVLHGGAPQGIAVEPALRAAAPLVGAGLDRIAHATLVEGLAPLDLAARAAIGLRLVGGETALSVVDLLEPARRPLRRS